jgi:uncharacterized membrane protein YvlD (DUF360 family)
MSIIEVLACAIASLLSIPLTTFLLSSYDFLLFNCCLWLPTTLVEADARPRAVTAYSSSLLVTY